MAKRYTRINWQNNASTPINPTFLNRMDKGIKDNDDAIGDLALLKTSNKTDLVGAINSTHDIVTKYKAFRVIISLTANTYKSSYFTLPEDISVSAHRPICIYTYNNNYVAANVVVSMCFIDTSNNRLYIQVKSDVTASHYFTILFIPTGNDLTPLE